MQSREASGERVIPSQNVDPPTPGAALAFFLPGCLCCFAVAALTADRIELTGSPDYVGVPLSTPLATLSSDSSPRTKRRLLY